MLQMRANRRRQLSGCAIRLAALAVLLLAVLPVQLARAQVEPCPPPEQNCNVVGRSAPADETEVEIREVAAREGTSRNALVWPLITLLVGVALGYAWASSVIRRAPTRGSVTKAIHDTFEARRKEATAHNVAVAQTVLNEAETHVTNAVLRLIPKD